MDPCCCAAKQSPSELPATLPRDNDMARSSSDPGFEGACRHVHPSLALPGNRDSGSSDSSLRSGSASTQGKGRGETYDEFFERMRSESWSLSSSSRDYYESFFLGSMPPVAINPIAGGAAPIAAPASTGQTSRPSAGPQTEAWGTLAFGDPRLLPAFQGCEAAGWEKLARLRGRRPGGAAGWARGRHRG
eukprot:CAMPEP_0174927710 /NCGR_PEP_ID=MMETSP1355-20121228/20193_1 /TAXON_ID=464990 /ORGANISM="Hemiselmis tepida, Strain CCMP443" /LENGTH=188 /DNA_ID=CAMNT_0016173833 /DNA_START=106 /DNA_END=669 /DNA_ORIENTATION=-